MPDAGLESVVTRAHAKPAAKDGLHQERSRLNVFRPQSSILTLRLPKHGEALDDPPVA